MQETGLDCRPAPPAPPPPPALTRARAAHERQQHPGLVEAGDAAQQLKPLASLQGQTSWLTRGAATARLGGSAGHGLGTAPSGRACCCHCCGAVALLHVLASRERVNDRLLMSHTQAHKAQQSIEGIHSKRWAGASWTHAANETAGAHDSAWMQVGADARFPSISPLTLLMHLPRCLLTWLASDAALAAARAARRE